MLTAIGYAATENILTYSTCRAGAMVARETTASPEVRTAMAWKRPRKTRLPMGIRSISSFPICDDGVSDGESLSPTVVTTHVEYEEGGPIDAVEDQEDECLRRLPS